MSRNDGMEIASGEYIFFLDSDDYIKQNVLTTLYQKIKNVDADVLYFGYEEHGVGDQDNIKRYSHKSIYPNVENGPDFFCRAGSERNMCVTSWSAIYKNQFLKENNIKFKPHIIHEDNLFYYEVLMKANSVTSVDDFCSITKSLLSFSDFSAINSVDVSLSVTAISSTFPSVR